VWDPGTGPRERAAIQHTPPFPHVVVYDAYLNVTSLSDGIGRFLRHWPDLWEDGSDGEVPAAATTFVGALLASREPGIREATGLLRPTLVVDVADLDRDGKRAIVAAFDRFAVRDPVRVAAQRYQLTDRERQILALLLTGMGAAEVAERLGLATMTVHAYFKRLRSKTGARTLSGMIATLLGWTAGA
jgi:DNA-binding CsgD family transcriptional regulator